MTMTFAHRRNRLTTHFTGRFPVAKQRIYVYRFIVNSTAL